MLLEARLTQDPRAQGEGSFACPSCKKPLRIQKKTQKRALPTSLGKVVYQRPYGICDGCGTSCIPLDHGLGIPARGASVDSLYKTCHAAVVGRSFEDGSEI